MSCPRCGCKTTYPYDDEDDEDDPYYERCAYCGAIFPVDDAGDEEDL